MSYGDYIRNEWRRFFEDPSRRLVASAAIKNLRLKRVLDLGCGAGQELVPLTETGAFGVGLDSAHESAPIARGLFKAFDPMRKVAFLCGTAECLPFRDDAFDVVICRVALPYMDNNLALAEIRRVLRPGGFFYVRIHHPRYYLRMFFQSAGRGKIRIAAYAARALVAGAMYQVLGVHLLRRYLPDTYQTKRMLERRIRPMEVLGHLRDSDSQCPSYLIRKPLLRTAEAENPDFLPPCEYEGFANPSSNSM